MNPYRPLIHEKKSPEIVKIAVAVPVSMHKEEAREQPHQSNDNYDADYLPLIEIAKIEKEHTTNYGLYVGLPLICLVVLIIFFIIIYCWFKAQINAWCHNLFTKDKPTTYITNDVYSNENYLKRQLRKSNVIFPKTTSEENLEVTEENLENLENLGSNLSIDPSKTVPNSNLSASNLSIANIQSNPSIQSDYQVSPSLSLSSRNDLHKACLSGSLDTLSDFKSTGRKQSYQKIPSSSTSNSESDIESQPQVRVNGKHIETETHISNVDNISQSQVNGVLVNGVLVNEDTYISNFAFADMPKRSASMTINDMIDMIDMPKHQHDENDMPKHQHDDNASFDALKKSFGAYDDFMMHQHLPHQHSFTPSAFIMHQHDENDMSKRSGSMMTSHDVFDRNVQPSVKTEKVMPIIIKERNERNFVESDDDSFKGSFESVEKDNVEVGDESVPFANIQHQGKFQPCIKVEQVENDTPIIAQNVKEPIAQNVKESETEIQFEVLKNNSVKVDKKDIIDGSQSGDLKRSRSKEASIPEAADSDENLSDEDNTSIKFQQLNYKKKNFLEGRINQLIFNAGRKEKTPQAQAIVEELGKYTRGIEIGNEMREKARLMAEEKMREMAEARLMAEEKTVVLDSIEIKIRNEVSRAKAEENTVAWSDTSDEEEEDKQHYVAIKENDKNLSEDKVSPNTMPTIDEDKESETEPDQRRLSNNEDNVSSIESEAEHEIEAEHETDGFEC